MDTNTHKGMVNVASLYSFVWQDWKETVNCAFNKIKESTERTD